MKKTEAHIQRKNKEMRNDVSEKNIYRSKNEKDNIISEVFKYEQCNR